MYRATAEYCGNKTMNKASELTCSGEEILTYKHLQQEANYSISQTSSLTLPRESQIQMPGGSRPINKISETNESGG